MYIDDCILGTEKIFNGSSKDVYNLGSSEQVSINQMTDLVEEIANYKVKRNYLLDKPKGVRGRSSDNSKLLNYLNWEPSIKLKDGLRETYNWIFQKISRGDNIDKFTRK